MKAYVLINASPGRALEVAKKMEGVNGITAADAITGEYDVIAVCEAPDVNSIGSLIVDKIQKIDDERSDRVHVRGLAYGDYVVLTSDRVGGRDAVDAFHLLGHFERASWRRVDEDVSLHADATPQSNSNRNGFRLTRAAR